ncbi:hypothetical protein [Priestia megaterium]|uniref:hypothetical protein n=1 Tax=Priestia megaterium TaxID=1404 RepID=UPI002FFF8133
MKIKEKSLGLIVPVNLTALCVGETDELLATGQFAGATLGFSDQLNQETEAFVGGFHARELFDPPAKQLEKGVHLHWAFPKALLNGQVNKEGELDFPALPNRWLICRYWLEEDKPKVRMWKVCSDAITPLQNGEYQIGSCKSLSSDRDITEPFQSLFSLFGQDLNPAVFSDLTYTSYYPNCRNMFGFHDELEDITIQNREAVSLMYSVVGWYSTNDSDPLSTSYSREDLETNFGWTFEGEEAFPSYMICNGSIQNVNWNPTHVYIHESPLQEPIDGDVAIGNYKEEAMAAHMRFRQGQKPAYYQTLFSAFQLDMLDKLEQFHVDQFANLHTDLENRQFQAKDAGSIYVVRKKQKKWSRKVKLSSEIENVELPPHLAERLSKLNLRRQQYDFNRFYIHKLGEQLFADWYQVLTAKDSVTRNFAYEKAGDRLYLLKNLKLNNQTVENQLQEEVTNFRILLGPELNLLEDSAPRYWQAKDFSIVLEGDQTVPPLRNSGGSRKSQNGFLECRLTNQVLNQVTLSCTILQSSMYEDIGVPQREEEHGLVMKQLFIEACLLNVNFWVMQTQKNKESLKAELWMKINQEEVESKEGEFPSSIGVQWWHSNPWLPLYLEWEADYLPLHPTEDGRFITSYNEGFFLEQFRIDTETGQIRYDTQKPVEVTRFPQRFRGWTLLGEEIKEDYIERMVHKLQSMGEMEESSYLVSQKKKGIGLAIQSLKGFNDALLMRKHHKQIAVNGINGSPNQRLSREIERVLEDNMYMMPHLNGSFQPIRSGFLQLSLKLVDTFGQRRDVKIGNFSCSESLQPQQPVPPNVIFVPPRITQASRLLFRWISANSNNVEEMNSHPATSPICGWIISTHLVPGLFLFNQKGKALGTMFLRGDQSTMTWESAPGEDLKINTTIHEALQNENPVLQQFALELYAKGANHFKRFWLTIDRAHENILPSDKMDGMEVFMGKPTAIAQASLRLELDGRSATNLSWKCFTENGFLETDNDFTQVQFPVVLGKHMQMKDGLVGFYKQATDQEGYDWSTFYSYAAEEAGFSDISIPSDSTLTLKASPKLPTSSNLANDTQKVLLLIEPRAPIYASAGILPVKNISVPTKHYEEVLSIMEFSFMTTPVLKGCQELNIPLNSLTGYQWSWWEKEKDGQNVNWSYYPRLVPVENKIYVDYTSQQITEGWLRLTPKLLEFRMTNNESQAFVPRIDDGKLFLKITNMKQRPVTFLPGKLVGEGQVNTGSVFYMHLGMLLSQEDIPRLKLNHINDPNGPVLWKFQCLKTPGKYGNYWVATPTERFELSPGESLTIQISDVKVTSDKEMVHLYFDYYNIEGTSNGVYQEIIRLKDQPI